MNTQVASAKSQWPEGVMISGLIWQSSRSRLSCMVNHIDVVSACASR